MDITIEQALAPLDGVLSTRQFERWKAKPADDLGGMTPEQAIAAGRLADVAKFTAWMCKVAMGVYT